MTKTQVEVITSVQRRRRWSRSEKERIVTAAMESGAVASEVARAAGIHTSQLFRWRQQLCERGAISGGVQSCSGRIRAGAGIARTDAGESWRHRHRVCYRRPDADHRSGRCFDGRSADEGVGEEQAAVTIRSRAAHGSGWRPVIPTCAIMRSARLC